MDIRYCYELSPKAGMAYNTRTGEPESAYIQVKIVAEKLLGNYEEMHAEIGKALAKDHGWHPEWVKPISVEEYDENQEEPV